MTDFKYITYGVQGGLATLTINKPPFNVLDIPMMEVPDLRRARHHREHPEAFFNPKVPW